MAWIERRVRGVRQLLAIAVVVCAQSLSAKISTIEFQDQAAELMLSALQTEPKESFLRRLYTRLLFVPVWIDASGMTPYAKALFEKIRTDGTLPHTSHLYKEAKTLEAQAKTVSIYPLVDQLALEMSISELYKQYADYTIYGSINWGAFLARLWNIKTKDIHADWVTHKPDIGPIEVLEAAVLQGDFNRAFDHAIPHRYRYRALQKRLIHYRQIAQTTPWKPLYFKGSLHPGKKYGIIPAVRQRLTLTTDYTPCQEQENPKSLRYDSCLKKAVIHFQRRHALHASGVINQATRKALNIPLSKRITKLQLNLDRIKWLRDTPPGKHIWINIPAFMLYVEQDGKLLQKIKVIVGKPGHPTPIFGDEVETIVLNPYWNIPKSIIQKEMIPKLLVNPYALKRRGIEIFNGWGNNAKIVDPTTVNWGEYLYSERVPYRFAQLPGKRNALGKIKFLFPNQFSVYMHDTPQKRLFRRGVRAFSHGCVRLSQPRALLKTFAHFEPNVDYQASQHILKGKERHRIDLQQKIPVDITYLTAWVDHDGTVQYRNDIYRYDTMQLHAYRKW